MRIANGYARRVRRHTQFGWKAGLAVANAGDTDVTDQQISDLTRVTREEIARADTKAAILLAADGALVSSAVGALTSRGWDPFASGIAVTVAFWITVVAMAGGTLLVASATVPRKGVRASANRSISYYGDIVAASANGTLEKSLATDEEQLRGQNLRQLECLALIADAKYKMIATGLGCILVGLVAASGTFLLCALAQP